MTALVSYHEATAADVPAMTRARALDPAAGPADERMALYFNGLHHPQQALPPRVGYVAYDDDAAIGYIAGHRTRRYDCDGELQYLYVAVDYRRQGVAAELLRRLASWFRGQHAARVCVNVAADNSGAWSFYMRYGARELHKHWLIWEDIDAVLRLE